MNFFSLSILYLFINTSIWANQDDDSKSDLDEEAGHTQIPQDGYETPEELIIRHPVCLGAPRRKTTRIRQLGLEEVNKALDFSEKGMEAEGNRIPSNHDLELIAQAQRRYIEQENTIMGFPAVETTDSIWLQPLMNPYDWIQCYVAKEKRAALLKKRKREPFDCRKEARKYFAFDPSHF